MNTASCLFVDVGPTRSAYAHVVALLTGQPVVKGVWFLEYDRAWIQGRLADMVAHAPYRDSSWATFAIETIGGEVYAGRSAAQLFETKRVEGRIAAVAEADGITPLQVAANDWRKTLVGNTHASNAQIAAAVRGIMGDTLPVMPPKVAEHMMDAIGGALVVLARMLARPSSPLSPSAKRDLAQKLLIPGGLLPRPVAQAVGLVQIEERAHRDAKKQAKAAGVQLPRRAPRRRTRSQEREAAEKGAATKARRKAGRLVKV